MKTNQGSRKKTNRRIRDPFKVRAARFFKKAGKAVLIIGALPALSFGGWRLYKEITTTERLALKTISVEGASKVSEELLVELSGLKPGQNILSFDKDEVIKGLKTNPWVESAVIDRSLPDTVIIEVKERMPVALVKLDEMYVMDSAGVVFKKFTQEDGLDLPVVTGLTKEYLGAEDNKGVQENLLRLISILSGRSGFNIANVSEINVDPAMGLSIYTLEDGVRLEVGLEDFEEKLASFERILKLRGGSLEGVEAMDLNDDREVVVRFTDNAVKEGGEEHGQKG